jgi:hypothetical protein
VGWAMLVFQTVGLVASSAPRIIVTGVEVWAVVVDLLRRNSPAIGFAKVVQAVMMRVRWGGGRGTGEGGQLTPVGTLCYPFARCPVALKPVFTKCLTVFRIPLAAPSPCPQPPKRSFVPPCNPLSRLLPCSLTPYPRT